MTPRIALAPEAGGGLAQRPDRLAQDDLPGVRDVLEVRLMERQ
jgi:hypothetical protein